MVYYYAKRFGHAVLVFLITVSITFVLYRLLPGGPIQAMRTRLIAQMSGAGGGISAQQMAQINQMVEHLTNIDPDAPLYVAYFDYMKQFFLHGDLGRSTFFNRQVSTLILQRLPWSVFISVYGLGIAITTSLSIGAMQAYKEGSKFDTGMTIFTMFNTTVPYYVFAIAFLIIFAFQLNWLPTGGKTTMGTQPGFNYPFMAGVIEHAALPILSSVLAGFGGALAFRGNCIREMGEGYIRVARLRGLRQSRLAIRYVGRNALLPIYTNLLMAIAIVFNSNIVLEQIFNYQAMGMLTFNALNNRDFPVLMGTLIVYTTLTLIGILIADLTYGIIDPRVKEGGERETF